MAWPTLGSRTAGEQNRTGQSESIDAGCTQARKTTHGLDGQHQDVDRTSRRSRTTAGQTTVEKQSSLQLDVVTSQAQLGEIRFAASELFASDMHGSLGTKPVLYRHTSTS